MVTNALSLQSPSSSTAQLWATALRLFGLTKRPASQAANRAVEAEELREFALKFVESDPRFATDLFGAADRHEGV